MAGGPARLRERAQVKRAELVERLAEALGRRPSEEKVASYYHEMEQGSLDSEGVSRAVLEALAGDRRLERREPAKSRAKAWPRAPRSATSPWIPAFTRMTKGHGMRRWRPGRSGASAGARARNRTMG